MIAETRMDKDVQEAVRIYGGYLDEVREDQSRRMDESIINAIRMIREWVYLRNPNNEGAQDAIVTAKSHKMTSAELEALLKKL